MWRCEQSFNTSHGLSAHVNAKYYHDGLQRNELNDMVFICNIYNKPFSSQRSLYHHRRLAKHAIDCMTDVGEAKESITEEAQVVYSNNGRIRNEISHEKNVWLNFRYQWLSVARCCQTSLSKRPRWNDSTVHDNRYRAQRRMGTCTKDNWTVWKRTTNDFDAWYI